MVSHCAPRLPAATALVFLECNDMADTAPYRIRTFGDPVLKRRAEEITDIDGRVARLAEDMHATLKVANGLGLAAPQVGVGRRLFVYEIGDSTGFDLDGREVSIEAVDLEARLYQHELDHLDGRLLLELLDDDQRKAAMRELRQRAETNGAQRAPSEL